MTDHAAELRSIRRSLDSRSRALVSCVRRVPGRANALSARPQERAQVAGRFVNDKWRRCGATVLRQLGRWCARGRRVCLRGEVRNRTPDTTHRLAFTGDMRSTDLPRGRNGRVPHHSPVREQATGEHGFRQELASGGGRSRASSAPPSATTRRDTNAHAVAPWRGVLAETLSLDPRLDPTSCEPRIGAHG
jgi:hypothetical protein